MTSQPTCAERIDAQLAGRIEDLVMLNNARRFSYIEDDQQAETLAWMRENGYIVQTEDDPQEIENAADEAINDYALSVEVKRTMVVQISTGGPGDQFEVDIDENGDIDTSATYRFLDWFDGATTETDDEDVMAFLQGFAEVAAQSV